MDVHNDHDAQQVPSDPPPTPQFPERLPGASSPGARARMKAARQRGTKPEQLLSEELDRLGLTYDVDKPPIPTMHRRADLCFPNERVAVFVDGCFWHGCPIHGTSPKANSEWWKAKLNTNKGRDADTNRALAEAGWIVLRFWEHISPQEAAAEIATVLARRRSAEQMLPGESSI